VQNSPGCNAMAEPASLISSTPAGGEESGGEARVPPCQEGDSAAMPCGVVEFRLALESRTRCTRTGRYEEGEGCSAALRCFSPGSALNRDPHSIGIKPCWVRSATGALLDRSRGLQVGLVAPALVVSDVGAEPYSGVVPTAPRGLASWCGAIYL
jgi:hypothetical protein